MKKVLPIICIILSVAAVAVSVYALILSILTLTASIMALFAIIYIMVGFISSVIISGLSFLFTKSKLCITAGITSAVAIVINIASFVIISL